MMRTNIARVVLALGGAAAMAWVVAVFPVFRFEITINDIYRGVIAGEVYSSDVLASVEALTETNRSLTHRSSVLSKVAVIRMRQAENAARSGDSEHAEHEFSAVEPTVRDALRNSPNDPFLWLVLFYIDRNRNGLRPENLLFLRMSYKLGPNEGWIAVKRNGYALADYSGLPNDLAERPVSEFVSLVRWGIVPQAAEIAAGPARPIRNILFPRLKDLNDEQRRAFAAAIYGRELDDVPVPGIAPPTPQIPMPVLPPDF
jgi:hypothetical protein